MEWREPWTRPSDALEDKLAASATDSEHAQEAQRRTDGRYQTPVEQRYRSENYALPLCADLGTQLGHVRRRLRRQLSGAAAFAQRGELGVERQRRAGDGAALYHTLLVELRVRPQHVGAAVLFDERPRDPYRLDAYWRWRQTL